MAYITKDEMTDNVKKMKKFVRYKEGAEMYSMGLSKFQEMAHMAGAVYKVNKLVLVNTERLDEFLETYRLAS